MPVAQVVHSVCPSIFGHNLVKLALALSLFGGIVKHVGTDNPDRVLMVLITLLRVLITLLRVLITLLRVLITLLRVLIILIRAPTNCREGFRP
jgi:hypothetical protein